MIVRPLLSLIFILPTITFTTNGDSASQTSTNKLECDSVLERIGEIEMMVESLKYQLEATKKKQTTTESQIQAQTLELAALRDQIPRARSARNVGKCVAYTTPRNAGTYQPLAWLDRHDVKCPTGQVLTRFQLVADWPPDSFAKYGGAAWPASDIHYAYTCCEIL